MPNRGQPNPNFVNFAQCWSHSGRIIAFEDHLVMLLSGPFNGVGSDCGTMLTNQALKTAKPGEKPKRLADGGGLYALQQPNGSILWQFAFQFRLKRRIMSFGPYPTVSLSEARTKRDEAKAHLRNGVDPQALKMGKIVTGVSVQPTVEQVGRAWYASQVYMWSEKHAREVLKSLEKHVFPTIGAMPIDQVTKLIVLDKVLRPIEARGTIEKMTRVQQRIEAIFERAEVEGRIASNPGTNLNAVLRRKPKVTPFPAILELAPLRAMMADMEDRNAHPSTRIAFRVTALTAMRQGAICSAEWSEFVLDGPNPTWNIPAEKMKGKQETRYPFTLPLVTQAVEALRALKRISGKGRFVFPGAVKATEANEQHGLEQDAPRWRVRGHPYPSRVP